MFKEKNKAPSPLQEYETSVYADPKVTSLLKQTKPSQLK